ncbi:MAG: hypothetical protein COT73_09665, partial [Bdellovibrio sp. CG10_big_fil_rev_8_21_14_0_10_47_8]
LSERGSKLGSRSTGEMLGIIGLQSPNRFLSPWVFPCRINKNRCFQSPQKAILRLRVFTKIDFVGHDFRRTAATTMAGLGVSRLVISKLLNHSDSSITNVYDRHSYDDEKRKALESWQNCLCQLISNEINMSNEQLSNTNSY